MGTPTTYQGLTLEVNDETVHAVPDTLPLAGRGSMRQVYDMGDVVVKIAREDRKWANILEAEVWEKVKDTPDARFFAAVFACAEDGSWLVMEKLPGAMLDMDHLSVSDQYRICNGFWRDNADTFVGLGMDRDAHPGNISLRDGEPVWIDYGYNETLHRG